MDMARVETASASAGRTAASGRLAGGTVVAALFAGSTLLTPLYELYQARYHLDALQLGLLYAVYAVGNLVALLFFGRLSDQVGRKPAVLGALVLAAASAALFLAARGPGLLFGGRVVSGLAVGVGSGAATAWIAESMPEEKRPRAAAVMTAFNFVGLTVGPVLAGTLTQYAPAPLRLPFVAYLAILILTALLALAPRETVAREGGPRPDLRPRLGVPEGVRLPFIAPAAAGFAAMAVVGFYAALGPALVKSALHLDNRALANLVVAELFVAAAVTIVASARARARTAMLWGLGLTPPGLGLLAAAQALASAPLMLAGTLVCGVASAVCYRGGLQVANGLAPQDRRAEVASSYFVSCFLGNALPIVGVAALTGYLGAGLADRIFAAVVAAIALGAIACNLVFGKPSASGPGSG